MTEDGIVVGGGESAEESPDDSAGEETESSQMGIVTTNGGDLNVRTGAGIENTAFVQLPNGTEVEVIGRDGDWAEILLPERVGYVYGSYLTIQAGGETDSDFTLSFSEEELSRLMELFMSGAFNLNQLSRKRENSILRSIGLTQNQLYKMIICEEIYYALFAMAATLIIGLPVAIFSCREISKISYAGEIIAYQFPFFEMGLFILVLLGLEFILSLWTRINS